MSDTKGHYAGTMQGGNPDECDRILGRDVARMLDPDERLAELSLHIRNHANLFGMERTLEALVFGLAQHYRDEAEDRALMADIEGGAR